MMSPHTVPCIKATLDSGASETYICKQDKECFTDIINIPTSLVGLPDKTINEIKQKGLLTLHINLSPAA